MHLLFGFAERPCEVIGISGIGCDVALGANLFVIASEFGFVKW